MSMDHLQLYNEHAAREAREAGVLFAPSPEEVSVLFAQEPGVRFTLARDVEITPGRQSRVSVLEYTQRGRTFRVVWKRMGADKGLVLEEATSMRRRLGPYRQSLEDNGWHIPKLFYSVVEKMSNEFQIYSYEEFIAGGDAEHMIRDPAQPIFRKWYLIEKVLRTLYGYPFDLRRQTLLGKELTLLPHGLDLKLANLVLEIGQDQLYFVDLFCPKEIADDSWVNYTPKLDSLPPDNLRAVTATREGAILRFWRSARKTWEPVRTLRPLLQDDFLDRLRACDPSPAEFDTIRNEMEGGFEWLNRVYAERSV